MKTSMLVKMAFLSGLIFILALTPLGFIPIGIFSATTIHIPVIIGAIMLGLRSGVLLGFIFGLVSFLIAHIHPTPASYFFSPLVSGNFYSLIVCFVPRILIGVVSYYIYNLFKKINVNLGLILAGLFGSLTNTILVLGFIYLFFAKEYSDILDTTISKLPYIIFATSAVNAIFEAIIASVFTLLICRILNKLNISTK